MNDLSAFSITRRWPMMRLSISLRTCLYAVESSAMAAKSFDVGSLSPAGGAASDVTGAGGGSAVEVVDMAFVVSSQPYTDA